MYKKFIVLLILSFSVSAQEVSQDQILQKLSSLKNSTVREYMEKMREISELSTDYIKTKEQECSGEYSSFVLGEAGEKKRKKNKLTKKEKSLCLYLLIDFRVKFTKLSFEIRKNHLKKLHQAQVDELNRMEQKQLTQLEKLSKKYK